MKGDCSIEIDAKEGVRGVYARWVIKQGETVLAIAPSHMLIGKHGNGMTARLHLIYQLCQLSQHSHSESWQAKYLSTLPQSCDLPAFDRQWDPSQCPSDIAWRLRRQRQQILQDLRILRRLDPQLPKSLFKWAWSLVNTRCLALNRHDLALVPVFDMLNHSFTPNAVIEIRDGTVHVMASQDIRAGEQVCISYGCHDNAFLWLEYGFTLVGNELDGVEINSFMTRLNDPLIAETIEGTACCTDYVVRCGDVCPMTWMVLRLMCLDVSDDVLMSEWNRALMEGGREISPSNETRARELLVDICQRALDSYHQLDTSKDYNYREIIDTRIHVLSDLIQQYE
jgi:hypothetical protein